MVTSRTVWVRVVVPSETVTTWPGRTFVLKLGVDVAQPCGGRDHLLKRAVGRGGVVIDLHADGGAWAPAVTGHAVRADGHLEPEGPGPLTGPGEGHGGDVPITVVVVHGDGDLVGQVVGRLPVATDREVDEEAALRVRGRPPTLPLPTAVEDADDELAVAGRCPGDRVGGAIHGRPDRHHLDVLGHVPGHRDVVTGRDVEADGLGEGARGVGHDVVELEQRPVARRRVVVDDQRQPLVGQPAAAVDRVLYGANRHARDLDLRVEDRGVAIGIAVDDLEPVEPGEVVASGREVGGPRSARGHRNVSGLALGFDPLTVIVGAEREDGHRLPRGARARDGVRGDVHAGDVQCDDGERGRPATSVGRDGVTDVDRDVEVHTDVAGGVCGGLLRVAKTVAGVRIVVQRDGHRVARRPRVAGHVRLPRRHRDRAGRRRHRGRGDGHRREQCRARERGTGSAVRPPGRRIGHAT